MITGLALSVLGLAIALWGATGFNFGRMLSGWIIAGIGAVIFVTKLLGAWLP